MADPHPATALPDKDCGELLQWALPRLGHRWPGYRKVRRQVCRRIAARIRELGLADAAAYRQRLEHDPTEWGRLRDCLPVTISRFFRDRGVFDLLRDVILPALASSAMPHGQGTLRLWSAGCASGEEPYSLGLLWALGLQARFPAIHLDILATDVDAEVLRRSERACYPGSSLRELPKGWLERAFVRVGDLHCLRPGFRAPIRFLRQDMTSDLPAGPFHLILCRNLAFTYFDECTQATLAVALAERLLPGGFLVLGRHEHLPADIEGLQPWMGRDDVLRKTDEHAP